MNQSSGELIRIGLPSSTGISVEQLVATESLPIGFNSDREYTRGSDILLNIVDDNGQDGFQVTLYAGMVMQVKEPGQEVRTVSGLNVIPIAPHTVFKLRDRQGRILIFQHMRRVSAGLELSPTTLLGWALRTLGRF